MSRVDPHTIPLTSNGRTAAGLGDLRARMAMQERGGGSGIVGGGALHSGDAVTGDVIGNLLGPITINPAATPQVAQLGLGVAAGATRLTFPTTSGVVGDGIDFGGGDIRAWRQAAGKLGFVGKMQFLSNGDANNTGTSFEVFGTADTAFSTGSPTVNVNRTNIIPTFTDAGGIGLGSRADAITSDLVNSATGAYYRCINGQSTFNVRGSLELYRAFVDFQEVGAGGVYGEAYGVETIVQGHRQGGLGGGIESVISQTTAGKQGRYSAGCFIAAPADAYSTYTSTIFGTGSPWINTGMRGIWIQQNQASGLIDEKAGTGLWISGRTGKGWIRAIVLNDGAGAGANGTDLFCVDGAGNIGVRDTVDKTRNTSGFTHAINIGWASAGTASIVAADGINFGDHVFFYSGSTGSLRVEAPTGGVNFRVSAATAAQTGRLTFTDGGTDKWSFRRTAANLFGIFDEVSGQNVFRFGASSATGTGQLQMKHNVDISLATSMLEYGLVAGNWDASTQATFRMTANFQGNFLNGTNGVRGDLITNEAPNGTGANTWTPMLRNAFFNGKGSYLGDYNVITTSEVEATQAITGIANNGSGLIRITYAGNTNLVTGSTVQITGVSGTGAANVNGNWVVTRISATTFDLATGAAGAASVFTGSPTGGTIQLATYSEAVALEAAVTTSVLGGLQKSEEGLLDIAAGKPCRAVGVDMVMLERNAFSAYQDQAVFGTSSTYTRTGSVGFRVYSAGTQPIGTGLSLMNATGAGGFQRFLAFEVSTVEKFVVDGSGNLQMNLTALPATLTAATATAGNWIRNGGGYFVSRATGTTAPFFQGWRNNTAETVPRIELLNLSGGTKILWSDGTTQDNAIARGSAGGVTNGLIFTGNGFAFGSGPLVINSVGLIDGDLGFTDIVGGRTLGVGTTGGLKIGGSITQKLGFWNKAPVVQPAAYTQNNGTPSRTLNAAGSETLVNTSAVLASLVNDLKLMGLIG